MTSSGKPEIDRVEEGIIAEFLRPHFPNFPPPSQKFTPGDAEQQRIQFVLDYVGRSFKRAKYVLGLALDFTLLAQRLSLVDTDAKSARKRLTEATLFRRYRRIKERGDTQANTLTLKFGDVTEGIRKIEESVSALFNELKRSSYPSAYVYDTGQWHKYKDVLVECFRLSEAARYELCRRLIHYGLENMAVANFYGRAVPRVALFTEIINNYKRAASGENGGLTFQALAYGFFKADRAHLSIVTDKVRRGSKRQRQIGDIDCYQGLDLEMSVEVKDLHVTSANLRRELGGFLQSLSGNKAPGAVLAASIDEEARGELEGHGVRVLTQQGVIKTVGLWDYPKQNAAVLGMLHYLSHVEQNALAVNRLLAFIQNLDPSHDALIYFDNQSAVVHTSQVTPPSRSRKEGNQE